MTGREEGKGARGDAVMRSVVGGDGETVESRGKIKKLGNYTG